MKELMGKTDLMIKSLLTLLLGKVNTPLLTFLKSGNFKLPTSQEPYDVIEFYREFIDYCKDKRITPIGMFKNNKFCKAIRWIFLTKGFDKKVFFNKLDKKWFDLKPQSTSESWYKLLLNIYNHGRKKKLEGDVEDE